MVHVEKVLGFGGFFFRSDDPSALARWYSENLGVAEVPTDYGGVCWQQEAGETVFAPFKRGTTYFDRPAPDSRPPAQFMLNFRVRDLDAMVAQLRGAGTDVEVETEVYPNGRFAKLFDSEGNPIQLWEPKDPGGSA
jgi:glyoxylase I family protein